MANQSTPDTTKAETSQKTPRSSSAAADSALLAFAPETKGERRNDPGPPPNLVIPAVKRAAVARGPAASKWPVRGLVKYAKDWMPTLPLVACVVLASVIYMLWDRYASATSATVAAANGTTIIDSQPRGLEVVIDEQVRGRTPVKLVLPLGNHTLKIQSNAEARSIPLSIEAGTITSQFVDFGQSAQKTGRLQIEGPQGSVVRLDGVVVGKSPLTLSDVAAGEHKIVVGTGGTASIVAAASPPSTTGGWVSFKTPFEMQVFEAERLVGTTSMERIMLPSGAHRFELVNAPLEFRTTTSVQVMAGSTATANIAVPNGVLSVNALPWAEVEIDGKSVGTTPLANISLPIGSHNIVWRHPQLGERQRTVTVTATAPVRVGVDFGQ
jgi:hypothetical protein